MKAKPCLYKSSADWRLVMMFRKLMTFEEAKKAINDHFKPVFLGEEEAVLPRSLQPRPQPRCDFNFRYSTV